MKYNHIFISGIGTDVGKTVSSAVLCQLLKADYWKPVQSGELDNTDSMKVEKLVAFDGFKTLPSKYVFQHPLSPHAAAKLENREINLDALTLPQNDRLTLIEGAGGLLVPLNSKGDFYIDLLSKWNIPTILISRNYLGSINHTLLSIEALKNRNIQLLGIVFVGEELPETMSLITATTGLKKLLHIPHFEEVTKNTITEFVEAEIEVGTLRNFEL